MAVVTPVVSAVAQAVVSAIPGIGGGGLPDTMSIQLANGYLYSRYEWPGDAANDAVQRYTLTAVPASYLANGVVAPSSIRLIPKATTDAGMAAAFEASTSYLATQPDEAGPMKYNNTFIGGSHGPGFPKKLTAVAHGKTTADIGSVWLSPGGVTFYLIAIYDVDTLLFMSGNTGTADKWSANTTLTANGTMTYVSNATNTSNIAYTTSVTWQIYPWLQNHTFTVKLNGSTVVTTGVHRCNYIQIVESYGIGDPFSMLAYILAGRPWATPPQFNHPSIRTQVLVEYTHEIHDNGSIRVPFRIQTLTPLDMNTNTGYAGVVQAGLIGYVSAGGAENVSLLTQRVNPIVGTLRTYDFEAGTIISGTMEALEVTSASWKNALNPPDRGIFVVKNTATGVRRHGLTVGYSRLSGVGTELSNYANNTLGISASRKLYPKMLTNRALGSANGTLPPIVVEGVAKRVMFNLALNPEASEVAVSLRPGGAEISLTFNQNVTNYAVKVPAKLNGMTATIVDSNGNLTLNNAVVTAGEIIVTVTSDYGEAVLDVA